MTQQNPPNDAKKIPGYSGYWITRNGEIYSNRSGNIVRLKDRISRSGYISATVTGDDGKRTSLGIHRLLALAYLQKKPDQTEVNHIDGNKFNNDLSNLEWCSHSANERHKVDNFLTKRTRPVEIYNLITKERIIVPSTREADKVLGLSVNSVSKMLQKVIPISCGEYEIKFVKR